MRARDINLCQSLNLLRGLEAAAPASHPIREPLIVVQGLLPVNMLRREFAVSGAFLLDVPLAILIREVLPRADKAAAAASLPMLFLGGHERARGQAPCRLRPEGCRC